MTDDYWHNRYAKGGTSGDGSRGPDAEAKADWVSAEIHLRGITSLLDVGCGDGYQANLFRLGECIYLGVDPARAALKKARQNAPGLTFAGMAGHQLPMDAHLSMDVLQHLIDERSYRQHLSLLFSARRFVLVYGTDHDQPGNAHVLHRHWTPDVPAEWKRVSNIALKNGKQFWTFERC